jgi:hypothetical protein
MELEAVSTLKLRDIKIDGKGKNLKGFDHKTGSPERR